MRAKGGRLEGEEIPERLLTDWKMMGRWALFLSVGGGLLALSFTIGIFLLLRLLAYNPLAYTPDIRDLGMLDMVRFVRWAAWVFLGVGAGMVLNLYRFGVGVLAALADKRQEGLERAWTFLLWHMRLGGVLLGVACVLFGLLFLALLIGWG
jgi:hypothetical protein